MTDLIVARNGRWVLASNGMPVALAREWHSAAEVRRQYPGYRPITDAEYEAARAFEPFPAITAEARIAPGRYVRCRCGESLIFELQFPLETCQWCGRTYRLRVEEVTDGK